MIVAYRNGNRGIVANPVAQQPPREVAPSRATRAASRRRGEAVLCGCAAGRGVPHARRLPTAVAGACPYSSSSTLPSRRPGCRTRCMATWTMNRFEAAPVQWPASRMVARCRLIRFDSIRSRAPAAASDSSRRPCSTQTRHSARRTNGAPSLSARASTCQTTRLNEPLVQVDQRHERAPVRHVTSVGRGRSPSAAS